jgi:hypothetical protein
MTFWIANQSASRAMVRLLNLPRKNSVPELVLSLETVWMIPLKTGLISPMNSGIPPTIFAIQRRIVTGMIRSPFPHVLSTCH